ncbi:MAG: M48 family metallopeptidase [Bacteroidota bacterium]
MTTHQTFQIAGESVPVKLVRERRRSVRAYMGKKEIIIRLPQHLAATQEQEHLNRLTDWLAQQFADKPALLQRYRQADYQNGDTLRVGQQTYRIFLREAARKTSKATINEGVIELELNDQLPPDRRSKTIKHLLSRIIAADQLPAITRRVFELNERYFQQPIQQVRLKYNHSNWGSCSDASNINLSTRLLFAPPDVIDYVIIHELAHLIELNHSDRFWALVKRAMPDYQAKEQWLKDYGSQCDF